MRAHPRSWLAVIGLFALAGCATQGIEQGTAVAKAGTEYSDALVGFLDVYLKTRIDVNSKRALEVRSAKVEAGLAGELPQTLDDFDKRARTAIKETARLRDNVRLLKAYFESLNALATASVAGEGGAALKSLGEAIQDVNAATGGAANTFTPEQLGYIEQIGKLAVKAAVSAKVREALQRDKEVIATQLVWEEYALRTLVKPVQDEFDRQLRDIRKEKIAGPYADPNAKLAAGWIDERRNWLQAQFDVGAFETARMAAAQMQSVWEDILVGHDDVQSVRAMLSDLKELTAVVRAFDEAEHRK
jgi:hypothetical protein